MTELAGDLCTFVDAGPSPFHAVGEMVRRLEAAGFTGLDERAPWALAPGDRRYVVRDGGSIVAFRVGARSPADAGFRLIGAHTDSPVFKVRPLPDVRREGYRLIGVEPYGGLLLHTWLDRDLTVAGRVAVAGPDGPELRLVHLPGAPLRIPSLAIHLYRELRDEGLKLDPQRHTVPVHGPEDDGEEPLMAQVAAQAGCAEDDLLGYDLVTADTQPSSVQGTSIRAPRLDNLLSCHAGVLALVDAEDADATQVFVANDHEEIGSGSAEGARGPFLEESLLRILAGAGDTDPQALPRAVASSLLVSADCAHAVHPNYADRHEPGHRPRLGAGPVVKSNANQAYATDAATAARFTAACRAADVTPQHFVTRADLPCGSTIGPLTATRLGLPTVDVGSPILSMHSCREQADARDVEPMVRALRAHLQM
jgi:aspartyl aminopeptidase